MCRALILIATTPTAALGESGEQQLGLLTAISAVLTASATADLVEFTRVLSSSFSDSAVTAALLPPSAAASEGVAGLSTRALLHVVQTVHIAIERPHGRYPLTALVLHLLHTWIPHHYLALLHLSRPSSTDAFPVAASSPASAATLSVFAALELGPMLRYACSDAFVASEGWSFTDSAERFAVANSCLTGDHMVLTRSGWRSIKRIVVGDIVASIHVGTPGDSTTATYAMEWKKVTHTQSFDAALHGDNQLFRMQAAGMDVIATRSHRMLLAHVTDGGNRLQTREPFGYSTVDALLKLSYTAHPKASATQFEYTRTRAVLRSGINLQPAVKLVIEGMERVCDWWWQKDQQLGFLRFLGFWLGDGHLCVKQGLVYIGQRKLESTARLIDLLDEVFPRWWYRTRTSSTIAAYSYVILCPPLFEYVREMAAGPPGYNPRDPAELRSYPHFVSAPAQPAGPHGPAQPSLLEVEAQSRYGHRRTAGHRWTQTAMLAALTAGPRPCACTECGETGGAMLVCCGDDCVHVDAITRAHPDCVGATFDEPWYCRRCKGEPEDVECRWWCADPQSVADTETEMLICEGCGCGGHLKCAKPTAPEEDDEDRPDSTRGGATQDAGRAQRWRVAGEILWWNNGWWIIIGGQWFYLKRWMGPNVASTFANLSQQQAVALLEGFCRADGEWASVQYDDGGEPVGMWRCSNSSFPLIDHLQLIGQLAGARVDLARHTKAGKQKTMEGRSAHFTVDHWALFFHFRKSHHVPVHSAYLAKPVDVSDDVDARGYYQYQDDGRVYDISVEGNSNFLTQRLVERPVRSSSKGVGVRAFPVFVGNCLQVMLVTLGHSLSMAADRVLSGGRSSSKALRTELFALFSRERSLRHALLAPLIAGSAAMEPLLEQRKRVEAAQLEDLLLHTLFVVRHLLRLEKAAALTTPFDQSASTIHGALLESFSGRRRPSAHELLTALRSHEAQPASFLHAAVLLLSTAFSSDTHVLTLSCLTLLATPLSSVPTSLFSHLSGVLEPLRRSLTRLMHPRAPARPALQPAVFALLTALVSFDTAVAELLLQTSEAHDRREAKEAEPAADANNAMASAVIAVVQETTALFSSQPALLAAAFALLEAVWCRSTAPLSTAVMHPVQQRARLWEAVQFVLAQRVRRAPGAATAADEFEEKERRKRGQAENDGGPGGDDSPDAVNGIDVSPAVQRYGHQLSIRAMALQLLAVEAWQQPSLPSPLRSLLSTSLFGSELRRVFVDFTRCTAAEDEQTQAEQWAQRLRLDLDACRNPQQEISAEDENKGKYLLEVAHRLLYDDLIAAAATETFMAARGPSPFPTSTFASPYDPSTEVAGSDDSSAGSRSLESHRALMTRLLAALADLNAVDHISVRQVQLATALHALLHSALAKQPGLLFPPSSPAAIVVLELLSSSLSAQRGYERSLARQGVVREQSELLCVLLQHFLSPQSGRVRELTSAILSSTERQQPGLEEQLRLVHRSVCGVLQHVLAALLHACHRALPPSCMQHAQEPLRWLYHAAPAALRPVLGDWLSTLEEEDSARLPPLPTEEGGSAVVSVTQALLVSASLLSRYASHLQAVYGVASSQPLPSQRPSGRSEEGSAARSLPRPLFSSPPSAGKASASAPLSPVLEGGEEDGGRAHRALNAPLATVLNATLLTLLCATVRLPELEDVSLAHIPLLLQRGQAAPAEVPPSAFAAEQSSSTALIVVDANSAASTALDGAAQPVRLVASLVLPLLSEFHSFPASSAPRAQAVLRVFAALASSPAGASVLQQHAVLLRLCSHPILGFQPSTDTAYAATPSPEPALSPPSFYPYLASGERDPWHVVWCRALDLVSVLLLHLPATAASLRSVLHFVFVHRVRLQRCLHRRQQRTLSLGHLEEADAAARLLAEVGKRLIVHSGAAVEDGELLAELRVVLLSVTEEFVRLLMDSRLMEERSTAISRAEKALAVPAVEHDAAAARYAEEERKKKEDASSTPKADDDGGKADKSKRAWRPLGSGAASSTAAPLRSPLSQSSPRSLSLRRRSNDSAVGADVAEHERERERGLSGDQARKARPSAIIPGAPALQAASFLLRSPVVAGMARGPSGTPLSAEAIFGAWASSTGPLPPADHAPLLVHRVEWSLCSILRSSLSFLRLCSSEESDGGRALFNYRSKVFDAAPLVGGRLREAEERVKDEAMEQYEEAGEYDDLLQADDSYDFLGIGDVQQEAALQRPRNRHPPSQPSAAPRTLSASPYLPPLAYRPPLSVMVDLCRYSCSLLIRLASIHPLIHQPPTAASTAHARLAALTPPALSAALPPMSSVLRLLQTLLEHALVVLVEQAERHVRALLGLFGQLHAVATKHRREQRQRRAPLRSLLSGRGAQSSPFAASAALSSSFPFAASPPLPSSSVASASESAPPHPASVACERVRVALDGYRERLLVVSEELLRASQASRGVPLERRRSALSPMSPHSAAASAERPATSSSSSSSSWSVASPVTPRSGSGRAGESIAAELRAGAGSGSGALVTRCRERLLELITDLERQTAAQSP